MLGKLNQILEYAKQVEHTKLEPHVKNALIFNRDMAEKADSILDSLGFDINDTLNQLGSVKEFCQHLEKNIKSLEKGGLTEILDKKPKW